MSVKIHKGFERRRATWSALPRETFDAVVVGGGINGATVFHHLSQAGFRVLLLDKGDFAGGTSQASAMMVWGGLLYLSTFDLPTVWRLCGAREELIGRLEGQVEARSFRCICTCPQRSIAWRVQLALIGYWLLGRMRRELPQRSLQFPERSFLRESCVADSFTYQEACAVPSDARFVLDWILSARTDRATALNYSELVDGGFDRSTKIWRLHVRNQLDGRETVVRSRWVVNTAGVWTDSVNRTFAVDSPFRHVFSKGVFLGIQRPERHGMPLIMYTGRNENSLALIPWGPVALWGPTETVTESVTEGFEVHLSDTQFLLDELNRYLSPRTAFDDIVSLRCGVRSLVLPASRPAPKSTLACSKKYLVQPDADRPWLTVYGGKLTSAVAVGRRVTYLLRCRLEPAVGRLSEGRTGWLEEEWIRKEPELIHFPGLAQQFPSPHWCAQNEMCVRLDDYLRRRTNIAQWVRRGGFGRNDENRGHLLEAATVLCGGSLGQARRMVDEYHSRIERELACLEAGTRHLEPADSAEAVAAGN